MTSPSNGILAPGFTKTTSFTFKGEGDNNNGFGNASINDTFSKTVPVTIILDNRKVTANSKKEITLKRTKNINSPEAIQKAKETRILNHTGKESVEENNFYEKLKLFIDESDIIRHYLDKNRYPFDCDFYIKSKDLFIEYQGHQTHGPAPYEPDNPVHWIIIDELQKHGFSELTFTVRDPNKVATAKQNKINLLLIYPKNNSYLVTNGNIKNIGKFDVAKINDLC